MYSPAAIDIAPPTRPGDPGGEHGVARGAGGGDADHEARGRDDAVVGAEHRGPQPAGTVALVVFLHVLMGPTPRTATLAFAASATRHRRTVMPEAVIVATARTPIGRANKGSLVDCRPDDLSALIIDAVLDKVPSLDPSLVEDVIWGCGQPAGEAGTNIGRVAGDPRRHRRAGCHRQPLLLVVAADDPHGRARDQGGRGRRVHLRRRRDRQPLPVRRGRHRFARTRSSAKRTTARSCARTAVSRRGRRPTGLPDVYIAMGQTAENVREIEGVTREEMDEFAAPGRSSARSTAQENGFFEREITPVTTRRRHGRHARTTARAPARRSRSSRRSSRCSVPTAR